MNDLFDRLSAWGVDVPTTLERFCGESTFYLKCLRRFLTESSFDLLCQAAETEDHTAMLEAAHSLKGVAGTLGLTPIFAPSETLVANLRREDFSSNEALYKAIMTGKQELTAILSDCGRLD
jgi:chemotaxis protein histidine kinase CheA